MLRNWIMVLLSTTLLAMPQGVINQSPFLTEQSTEKVAGLDIKDYRHEIKLEVEKLKAEKEQEKKRKEEELANLQKQQNKKRMINFELTFYTFLECKDKWDAVTCHGDKPYQGIVASNIYPQGTVIHLEGWGEVLVWDRGGSNFNSPNRLDVFIDPLPNETEAQYKARAFSLGRIFTKGYIKER
nr:MAG TPA: 3D containing protein [Caudoviricetes sp.]